jgi:hypothetical protein
MPTIKKGHRLFSKTIIEGRKLLQPLQFIFPNYHTAGPGKLSGGFDHQSGANDQFFCKAHLYGCAEKLRRGVLYVREGIEEGREW